MHMASEDLEYAEALRRMFDVKAELIVLARQEGRLLAQRDKRLGRSENGRTYARAYRIFCFSADTDEETQSLLEQVFLVSYTTEYYAEDVTKIPPESLKTKEV
jgi:hypothetical protein